MLREMPNAPSVAWGFLAAMLYEQRRLWTLADCLPWGRGLLAGVAYRHSVYQHTTTAIACAIPVVPEQPRRTGDSQ